VNIRKIVLSGTAFYGYLNSIADAFRVNGVEVETLPYPNVRNGWRSLPNRVLGTKAMENIVRHRTLARILGAGRDADLVVLVRGDVLHPEDLDTIREVCGVPVALWTIDSIHRMVNGAELCQHADAVFLYNKGEINDPTCRGRPAFFLPLAYHQPEYYRIPESEKDVDLYYLGTFHSDRMEFLNTVIENLEGRGFRIVIDGRFVPPWRPLLRLELQRRFPHLMRYATNRQVDHSHINRMTNRAKICLNFLPDQATSGLNTRSFEICGAGGFQIISRNKVLDTLFSDGQEVVGFDDLSDLVGKIRYFLDQAHEDERAEIARRGFERAIREHIFVVRVGSFLNSVKPLLENGGF